ncbi:MAG: hypothetical protein AB1566_04710 [Chloroflexota bacterium]
MIDQERIKKASSRVITSANPAIFITRLATSSEFFAIVQNGGPRR